LLDEPFTGLDEAARQTLRARLDGVRTGGAIVLLTTHDTAAVTGLTDASVSLDEGKLVARPPDGLRPENGEAPARQGANCEHTGGM
jgi:biotin transport system ATP-binding protein